MTSAEREAHRHKLAAYHRAYRRRPKPVSEQEAVRRAKIASAKRDKPRPRHVIEAMIRGRPAKSVSAAARAKMSAVPARRITSGR